MKNASLIAKKIARAKEIISRCKDINPPRWCIVWAKKDKTNSK